MMSAEKTPPPNWAAQITDVQTHVAMEFKLDSLEKKVEALTDRVADIEKSLVDADRRALERERAQLRWGVGALGTAVLVMGALIWSHLPGILDRQR